MRWLTNHHPSVLWHCWLGHLTHKIVSEMTYNVSSGTLNTTIPYLVVNISCSGSCHVVALYKLLYYYYYHQQLTVFLVDTSCWLANFRNTVSVKVKVSVFIYHTFCSTSHSRRSGTDHTVLPAITPYLPLPRKHSPDGASPDWGCRHLTAAYYSFIYPKRMKGWVGLVGWPTADGLPT